MSEVRAAESLERENDEDALPRRLGLAALAHDAVVYGGVRVLLKSLAFLLVPLYARFLTPAQFGVLELVLATSALLDVFIAMSGVLARFYYDRDDPASRRQAITLYFTISAAYPAVLIGALIAFSPFVAELVTGAKAYAVLFVIAFVDVYLTNIVDLPMALCRLRRKPWTFAFYALTRGLIQVILSVLLVAVWDFGVKGILVASLVSVCVTFVISLREYVRDLVRNLDWGIAREMVSFAWPTVFGALAFYTLNLVDRFFIKHYHGLEDNGLYGVAFRYSQIVLVGVFAFRMGWPQWHYSWLHSGRHPQMVARGANYYFFASGFLAVAVAAWILPLFRLILPSRYWDAATAVTPLSIAAVLTGAYAVAVVGLNVTKRMRLVPPTALVGAAVAVGLYFLLIPPYSFVGAAWATAVAMAVLALLVGAVSRRIYPVPWDWRRLGLAFGATVGLSLAALALDAWMPLLASVPVRAVLTAAYPVLLVALGFFSREDLAAIRALPARLRHRA